MRAKIGLRYWTPRQHRFLPLARLNNAMSGDDAGRVTEVNVSEGAQGTRSAYIGIRANGRYRVAQRSDRLSVEELAPQTVSRPALALSRR